MKYIVIESARARLLNEIKTFVCTSCWRFIQTAPIKDIPDPFTCPKCSSNRIGVLNEAAEEVERISNKIGKKMAVKEKQTVQKSLQTGKLMSEHGKLAALALAGKNLTISDTKAILSKAQSFGDPFIELIVERERKALAKRF